MKMMKKNLVLLISAIALFSFFNLNAEENNLKQIANAKVKNLKGEVVNTENFSNEGKPYIVTFWATWCKPCISEMKAISEVYTDWQEETGVKIFAVSIDDTKSSKNVAPFVKGRKIPFDVYLDENSDFKRAMNVNNPPHTFLFNGNGEIVWQHNGYAPGDEEVLFEQFKKLTQE